MDYIKLFSGGFPLNTARLQFLQNTYTKAISQLTKIAGNGNLIIEGVELDEGTTPSTVSAGVIIINGEILEFRAGDYSNTISIYEEETNVAYNEDVNQDGDLDQKPADTVRYAQCGTGGVSSVLYSSLTRISSIINLMPKIGDIKMIFRAPEDIVEPGWVLCDGTNGTPDLRNRFPIGAGSENNLGATGGAKEVTLTTGQLPAHSHTGNAASGGTHSHGYEDSYYIENQTNPNYEDNFVGNGKTGAGDTDGDNSYIWYRNRNTDNGGAHGHSLNIENTGNNEGHENRPPYTAVNFMMFVGF